MLQGVVLLAVAARPRSRAAPQAGARVIAAMFSLAFLAQVIRIAVPYVFAALGGAVTERAGVIDLALEAKLLFGAFAAAAVGHATGSAALGIAGGMAAGMAVARGAGRAARCGCAPIR